MSFDVIIPLLDLYLRDVYATVGEDSYGRTLTMAIFVAVEAGAKLGMHNLGNA